MGGPLVLDRAKPGQIVPVDSEHSALAQCLRGGSAEEVRRLVLTASGGPFRGRTRDELADVTPEQAMNHPTWDMGPVITINSATLVNKGLEVIEAHLLFGIPFDRIEVVVHPTSVVHSMVEFVDGSTLVQASPPTMLIPIALGLAWPDRVPDAAPSVDWTRPETWEFFPLDDEAFPAVALARAAGERGGDRSGRLQRGQRGVRRRLPQGSSRLQRDRAHGSGCSQHARRTLDGAVDDRRGRSSRPTPGRATPPPRGSKQPDDRPVLPAGRGDLRRRHPGLDRSPRARPHDPREEVRREGHAVLHRLRSDGVEQAGRRDGVRRQGDPARRLRQDRRHAPAGRRGPRRRGDVRRPGQPGRQGPQVQHRPVHAARLRRPRGRVGDDQARGLRPPLLQDDVVEEGRRDGRRADGEPADRVLHLRRCLRDVRQPQRGQALQPGRQRGRRLRAAGQRAATAPARRATRSHPRRPPGSSPATGSSPSTARRSRRGRRCRTRSGPTRTAPRRSSSSATARS